MATLAPVESKLASRPTYSDYGVRLQPVRNPILHSILYLLPWLVLVVLVIEMVQAFINRSAASPDIDWLFFTAQFTAALVLFAFQMLMEQIPQAFDVLWSRDIIALKPGTNPTPTQASTPDGGSTSAGGLNDLVHQYAGFLNGVEYSLNHPGSYVLGIVFAALGVIRFPYEMGGLTPFLTQLSQWQTTDQLEVVFEGLIGFVLGLMAWRMVFTALQVSELDNRFDLNIKFEHPDAAGGLEPLGNLCLWNALILTIAGIFFGIWLIIGPRFPQYFDENGRFFYNNLYYTLLLLPIIFAPICFLLPLWSVHRLMVDKAVALKRDLDNLGESIDRLGRELLTNADELDPEVAQKKIKSLELMQQLYKSNQNIPLWPLNLSLLTKFVTAEVVPLLGLTGLGQPLLKVVDALTRFLGQ
jgi:hypothetical protein